METITTTELYINLFEQNWLIYKNKNNHSNKSEVKKNISCPESET